MKKLLIIIPLLGVLIAGGFIIYKEFLNPRKKKEEEILNRIVELHLGKTIPKEREKWYKNKFSTMSDKELDIVLKEFKSDHFIKDSGYTDEYLKIAEKYKLSGGA